MSCDTRNSVSNPEMITILLAALYKGGHKPASGKQRAVIHTLFANSEFTDPESIWLSARQICQVSRGTVYNIIRRLVVKGYIEREKVGGRYRYRLRL